MTEIKGRIEGINLCVTGKLTPPLPQRAVEEFSYLQLRMICELIALAALVAHGHVEATRKGRIRTAHEADWIIRALSKIHPNFYPRPSRQILDDKGYPTEIEAIKTGYLTRSELIALYHECGGVLHRGNAHSILERKSRPIDFVRITTWASKVVTLLSHHQISVINEPREYWIMLSAEDGQVHWFIMDKVDSTNPPKP